MKKKLISVLLLGVMLMAIVACGKQDEKSKESEVIDTLAVEETQTVAETTVAGKTETIAETESTIELSDAATEDVTEMAVQNSLYDEADFKLDSFSEAGDIKLVQYNTDADKNYVVGSENLYDAVVTPLSYSYEVLDDAIHYEFFCEVDRSNWSYDYTNTSIMYGVLDMANGVVFDTDSEDCPIEYNQEYIVLSDMLCDISIDIVVPLGYETAIFVVPSLKEAHEDVTVYANIDNVSVNYAIENDCGFFAMMAPLDDVTSYEWNISD